MGERERRPNPERCEPVSAVGDTDSRDSDYTISTGTLTGGSGMETGNWLRRGDTLKLVLNGIGEVEHRSSET